jgi:hypothetical protein
MGASDLRVTDSVVDAAYLLRQVAEQLDSSYGGLEAAVGQAEANPWSGQSKDTLLEAMQALRPFHEALRDISADFLDATLSMMADHDQATGSAGKVASIENLY